jgi:hypothetical protein
VTSLDPAVPYTEHDQEVYDNGFNDALDWILEEFESELSINGLRRIVRLRDK